MQIRGAIQADLLNIAEIDGVIESPRYLHLERAGEGLDVAWSLSERPLRQNAVRGNMLSEDDSFLLRQIVSGTDEGLALVIDLNEVPVAFALAQPDFAANTLRLIDMRVDYDLRRQGMGSALVYRLIEEARKLETRAISAMVPANNYPAAQFLLKLGFSLAGLDEKLRSNHDLVKEEVTLFWYLTLD